eukprot:m.9566 g.9566  ORF g.9566 m.9566 type:complete len:320 (-) comp7801_c0_seq1:165-1124(-)
MVSSLLVLRVLFTVLLTRAATVSSQACAYADCAAYCSGKCPFRPNISQPIVESMTVWRITPWNVTDLPDHNTGDAEGDMGFLLSKYMRSSTCLPPYATQSCFLDDHPIVAQFEVEFDAEYGPYLHCNPTPIQDSPYVNTSEFICAYTAPGPNMWKPIGKTGCAAPCNQANVSVGKDPAHHIWNTSAASKSGITSYFGGYWYSTPSQSECKGTSAPRDGSGCTWRLSPQTTPKYVNASCVADSLFTVLKNKNPSCFQACGPGAGRGNTCFGDCVTETTLGKPVNTGAGISVQSMVQAWNEAFDGGCPLINVTANSKYTPR